MPTYTALPSLFSAIANAIRGKTGSSAQMVADEFPEEIAAIPGARMATATASPGSGTSLSLSFSGLQGEPKMFGVRAPANTITTSYSYRRVIFVGYDGTADMFGVSGKGPTGGSSMNLYSTGSRFSFTYNNGTLTITSSGSTTGGYFVNGNYTLMYAY